MLTQDRAILHPGCCKLCRNDEGAVVDTGIEEEWVGRLYICFNCARELGKMAGCIHPDEAAADAAELTQLRHDVGVLRSQLDAEKLLVVAYEGRAATAKATKATTAKKTPVTV